MLSVEERLVQTLAEMGLTVSSAESCTGGMIASTIIDVVGASEVYNEGFITYSNEAKMKYLNVSEEALEKYGAVSYQTALEMAIGARSAAKSDIAVSVTGIAGPGGGTAEKPVGLVYIAIADKNGAEYRKLLLDGNRDEIRAKTCDCVFELIKERLKF